MSKDPRRYGQKPPEDRTEAEGRQLRWRSGLLIALFLAALGGYGYLLYDIQIVHGDEYRTTASYTTVQTEQVDSVRGEILDSLGRVLVSNTAGNEVRLDVSVMGNDRNDILAQLLELCREEGVEWTDSLPISQSAPYYFTRSDVYTYLLDRTSTDDDGNDVTTQERRKTNLGALAVKCKWIDDPLETDEEELTEDGESQQNQTGRVTYLSAQDLMASMCDTFGVELADPAEISTETRQLLGVLYELYLRTKEVTYTEYVFAENVDITFISRVKEQGLDGVQIQSVATRQYNTTYAAHVLGRVGLISTEEWPAYKELGYPMDAYVGKEGVELAFESYLHGTSGTRKITTSDSGKIVSQEWVEEPEPGGNVTLTLDIGLQAVVENSIAAHVASLTESGGAACAVVDMTGGVLALASYPTYDLSTYSQNFAELSQDSLQPYLNRATSELYAPGSTFKLLTATAGLMEGIVTPRDTTYCGGSYTYSGWKDTLRYCHKRSGHGTENLVKAIKDSCNVYFYDLGRRVGITKLNEYAAQFGLGKSTGIEIGDLAGFVAGPDTSEYYGQTWQIGNILSAAIGQENNQFTPLQLANYIATLVNGGNNYACHLLKSVKSSDYSQVLYQYEPELRSSIDIPDSYLSAMKEGMYQVTQNSAIAKYFNNLPVKAGAKTGTAELTTGSDTKETNGLLVVFAPYDDPQIALCIVMEKGASGSSLASIAYDILDYYFSSEDSLSTVTSENTLVR